MISSVFVLKWLYLFFNFSRKKRILPVQTSAGQQGAGNAGIDAERSTQTVSYLIMMGVGRDACNFYFIFCLSKYQFAPYYYYFSKLTKTMKLHLRKFGCGASLQKFNPECKPNSEISFYL